VISQNEVRNSEQWVDCLTYMSRRVKEQSFDTWLKPTKGAPGDNGEFRLIVPNQFVADWIDSHFRTLIDEAFGEVLGKKFNIVYKIATSKEDPQIALGFENREQSPPPGNSIPMAPVHKHNLSPRYRFDSLVVGEFNQFPCAASMAVAEEPGMTKYNPLLLYGRTGLGKTHIIQAIGHRIHELFPEKRVVYATSEKFTSDFIASISDRVISNFTRMYRDVDVLIIDDIQFFSGKESTQEQFFHTFNTLYHFGKQIVLSSDRSPKDIKGLEERLLSRFSWGLVADLQAPDVEARTAILYKKLETEGVSLPNAVVTYIAENISTNVRELEGALTRFLAYTSLKKEPPSLEVARKVLSEAFSPQRREITIERIQQNAAESFKIDINMMKAKKKTSEVVIARQVAMYLARSLTDYSLKVIGNEFGGRDHSTVIHACDLVAKKMAIDSTFRNKVDSISAAIVY